MGSSHQEGRIGIQSSRGKDWDPINWFNTHFLDGFYRLRMFNNFQQYFNYCKFQNFGDAFLNVRMATGRGSQELSLHFEIHVCSLQ